MLKNYAFLIALSLSSLFSFAGHEEGGVIISYRSLAQATGDSLEYEITVYTVYSTFGVSPPLNFSITESSSCYSNTTYSIPRIANPSGGALWSLSDNDYCAPGTNLNSNFGMGIYRDTVILPGTCSDFRFSNSSGFGRYNLTANIASNFSTSYFFVTLNNTNGPNSCPQVNPLDVIQAACLLKPLTLYGFTENDGDSVVYTPSTPQYSSGLSITNYSYNLGYSRQNPVGSNTGYVLDSATGVVTTSLNTIGKYAIGIKFVEYRYDSAVGLPVQISKGRFIMNLVAASSCNTAAFDIQHRNIAGSDSIACRESEITFEASRKVEPLSISPNASEFVISSNRDPGLSVISASVVSDSIIKLQLNQNVSSSDTISLWIKDGTDTNTIYTICGKELTAFDDTLQFFTPALTPINTGFTYTNNLLSVSFNSTSSSQNVDSLIWDFGDGGPGGSINVNNPTHSYASPGTYQVCLIGINNCGEMDSTCQTIIVCDSVSAAFTFDQVGDTLSYNASGSYGASTYRWDFGDGNTATGAIGKHGYSSSGNYNVTLTVFNDCGDSSVFTILIVNCAPPTVWWTYTIITTSQNGMQVAFDGTASTNASRYIWDFGDGTVDSSSLTPTHTYSTPSLTYLVSLQVFNSCSDQVSLSYRLNQIGLEENEIVPSFSIYPNPTRDWVEVEWKHLKSNTLDIKLYDVNGKLIISKGVSQRDYPDSKLRIATDWLPSGIYTLRIEGKDFISSQKLMVNPPTQ